MTKQFSSPSAMVPSTVYTVIIVITQPFKLKYKQIQTMLKIINIYTCVCICIYTYTYVMYKILMNAAAFNRVISQIYEVPSQTLPLP